MLSSLRFHQHAPDIGGLELFAAGMFCVLVLGSTTGFAYVEHAHRQASEQRRVDLACLAQNVYFEARGEPLVGQYAVAEVTMNRVASQLFPDSVCEVVHEKHWDPRRKRDVSAFSWTELDSLQRPYGYEWRRAQAVASTIYDNFQEAPLADGALFYHATRVSPDWARSKTRVARIGEHLFYE